MVQAVLMVGGTTSIERIHGQSAALTLVGTFVMCIIIILVFYLNIRSDFVF